MARKRQNDLIATTNSADEMTLRTPAIPATCEITIGKSDFQSLLDEKLPEIAPELKKLAPERNKYSLLSLILILLFLIATGYTVYLFFPRPKSLDTVNLDIPLPYRTNYSGKHSAVFSEAEELFKRQEYRRAANILQTPVKDLLANFTPHEGDAIFYRYFSIFNIIMPGDAEKELLTDLIAKEPDQLSWKFFQIVFNPLLHGKISLPPDNKLNVDEKLSVLPTLQQIEALRTIIDNGNGDPKYIVQLDYYRCCLYYYLWRCRNYGKLSERDSRYRQEAEIIARQYPDNREFLVLRKIILNKQIEHTGFLSFRQRSNLQKEVNAITKKINTLPENDKK